MAKIEHTTGKAPFRYPRIIKPDMKFATTPDGGKYKNEQVYDEDDPKVAEIVDSFRAAAIEEWGAKKAKTATESFFAKLGDGKVVLRAESKFKPGISDSKGNLLDNPDHLKIGNGTIGRMKIAPNFAESNGKLYLKAFLNGVQITKLVEYQGGAGFAPDEDDDDGFVAGDYTPPAEEPKTEAPDTGKPKSATDF